MYRVGLPLWKLAARLQCPVKFRVDIHKDEDTGTYWAASHDLDGLCVAGDTLDEVHLAVMDAASALLQEAFHGGRAKAKAEVHFSAALACAA